MNKTGFSAFLLSLFFLVSCQNNSPQKEVKDKRQEIENYLEKQMQLHSIPGLALAVIQNGKVSYEGYFGKADIANDLAVNKHTLFPLYSITKLATAIAIHQLVEQEQLSLDDTLAHYLDHLPQHWQGIKIVHLLTHSSGLPDFKFPDRQLTDEALNKKLFPEELHFNPGNQYEYNQTNYWLLAQIIEQITQKSFREFILENQFPDADNKALISSDFTDSIPHRANRYFYINELKKYRKAGINFRQRSHACNGLNLTLDEFVQWNKRLDENNLLRSVTKQNMWKPFPFRNAKDQFLHGWKIYHSNNTTSYGFTGGLQTAYRKFVDKELTILLLTNGSKYFPVHNDIVHRIAGIVDSSLEDKKVIVQQTLTQLFLSHHLDEALEKYNQLKSEYPNISFEELLNKLGYVFLNQGEVTKAIRIFEVNAKEHPQSANCFDSLAEAYLENNQWELAKKNYEKSLQLHPENENAHALLKVIEERMVK